MATTTISPSKKITAIKEKRITPSNVSGLEWSVVTLSLLFMDGVQALLTALGVGLVVSTLVDILVVIALILYLLLRGEFKDPQTKKHMLIALFAIFGLEFIPGVNALPFWFMDGFVLWGLSIQRNIKSKAQVVRVKEITKNLTAFERKQKLLALQEYYALEEERRMMEEAVVEGEQMLEDEQMLQEVEAGLR